MIFTATARTAARRVVPAVAALAAVVGLAAGPAHGLGAAPGDAPARATSFVCVHVEQLHVGACVEEPIGWTLDQVWGLLYWLL